MSFLDRVRGYLQMEKSQPALVFDFVSVEDTQAGVPAHYYKIGRESMLEDILKWEQGLKEREFRIRIKKGTL